MKRILALWILCIFCTVISGTAVISAGEIKLLRHHSEIHPDVRDIVRFLNVEYLKIDFAGEGLTGKSYHIQVSEIWNGEITNTATIFNSAGIPSPHLQTIASDTFQIRVVSERTAENLLRMHFNMPGLTILQEYDAVQSDDYSLRHAYTAPETPITPGEPFFLLTYILPYERDGVKQYCTIEASGSDVYNWGKEFGIEHYLVFEMTFDSPDVP